MILVKDTRETGIEQKNVERKLMRWNQIEGLYFRAKVDFWNVTSQAKELQGGGTVDWALKLQTTRLGCYGCLPVTYNK